MIRLLIACTLLVVALPIAAAAQGTPAAVLTGTVVDAETGEPLPAAHVFIATSMIGTTTDAEGHYRLERVPLGAHRLYVSILGYEPEPRDILLREPGPHSFDFKLMPAVVEVGEVTVEGKEDKRWQRRLEKFTQLFVGETAFAESAKIVNPFVLDFEQDGLEFKARASETLVIENEALGYRIHYFLKDFASTPTRVRYDGEPLFEEMEPKNQQQADEWAQNRRMAFYGSFRHFALALLNDRVEDEGFVLYSRQVGRDNAGNPQPRPERAPLAPRDLFKATDRPTEKMLDFPGFAEIVYTGEEEDEGYLLWQGRGGRPKYQSSFLLLENGPTLLDAKGDLLDPYGVTFFGYLAYERVADELPKEYRPWH